MNDSSSAAPAAVHEPLGLLLNRQRAAFGTQGRLASAAQRRDALQRLETAILAHREPFAAAISADFGGRAAAETLLMEINGVVDEIRHARRHLARWMRPRRVWANWQMQPARASIRYQPRGVIGVIGAYNYPAYLCLSPLVGALAAGNHVMLKPSEQTPCTGELLRALLAELFPEELVSVVLGGAEVSQAFASLPFDHLLFTGSARVGRLVLQQASAQLTPVTLELGGKSPAIVGAGYPLREAARSILHAKLVNAGQTCVAPDYVWLPEALLPAFVEEARAAVAEYYPQLVANPQYTRLISSTAWDRLAGGLEEARAAGAAIATLNPAFETCSRDNRVFAPTLVWNCPDTVLLMRQEIFGPILPLKTYRELDEVIAAINAGPRPLALYVFERDRERVEQVLAHTHSGGVTVNGCVYHVAQHNLPLGGIGESGMGAYHGWHGFQTFSAQRAVFEPSRWLPLHWLRPPFGRVMAWLLGVLLHQRPGAEPLRLVAGDGRNPQD